MNQVLAQAIKHWEYIAPLTEHPSNKKEFATLIEYLDELINIVEDDENHRLMGLVDVVSNLISTYEEEHYQNKLGRKGIDALKFLMDSHQLRQSDLSEIGSQGVISEILHGKRILNLRQIQLLAKRFNVKPDTFIDS